MNLVWVWGVDYCYLMDLMKIFYGLLKIYSFRIYKMDLG